MTMKHLLTILFILLFSIPAHAEEENHLRITAGPSFTALPSFGNNPRYLVMGGVGVQAMCALGYILPDKRVDEFLIGYSFHYLTDGVSEEVIQPTLDFGWAPQFFRGNSTGFSVPLLIRAGGSLPASEVSHATGFLVGLSVGPRFDFGPITLGLEWGPTMVIGNTQWSGLRTNLGLGVKL